MMIRFRLAHLAYAWVAAPVIALAQAGLDPADLQFRDLAQCADLQARFENEVSGTQWLVGEGIALYAGPSGSAQSFTTPAETFDRVRCYSRTGRTANTGRVFVTSDDGRFCGWVDGEDLLAENPLTETLFPARRTGPVCDVPRAMKFSEFCRSYERIAGESHRFCQGVPPALRAKAVLTGSTADRAATPFYASPDSDRALEAKPFFSILEIHDIARSRTGDPVVLVGDGEGSLFGWVSPQALELWPTRLGLFYDTEGEGWMYPTEGDLLLDARATGQGRAARSRISSSLSPDAITAFVNGNLPLVSYPIIRTIEEPGTPSRHQVVFLGQVGEGSASELIEQSVLSQEVARVRDINVMLVVDTTESMRPYLPLLQEGIARFARNYEIRARDTGEALPRMRLSVMAYSDFENGSRTELGAPITMQEVMAVTEFGSGADPFDQIELIESHRGLNDRAGGHAEAALEAAAALSGDFASDPRWFVDGPRILIEIADHGSREGVEPSDVLRILADNRTNYMPIAVLTDDQGSPSRKAAREAFMSQSLAMMSPLSPVATPEDVETIDFRNGEVTPEVINATIFRVLGEVAEASDDLRISLTGSDLSRASRLAMDFASSRLELNERIAEQYGLDQVSDRVIVEASTAWAPLNLPTAGAEPIDWTYTVAMEPEQASQLRQAYERMCELSGRGDTVENLVDLIEALIELFSGDDSDRGRGTAAILRELSDLPGTSGSFLAQDPEVLIRRARSTDPAAQDKLRRDICWTSFHLTNMGSDIYARPEDVAWNGTGYQMKPETSVIDREYIYDPLIGTRTVYLPVFFFQVPSQVEELEQSVEDCFFCEQ